MIGFDLFLHAGLLASFYTRPSPFLLPPASAFALIPLGYLSFLILAVLLGWRMDRLEGRGWRRGLAFGLKLGALIWGAQVLGLLSITTAEAALLASWFFVQTVELGIAGAVAGVGLKGGRLARLLGWVVLFVVCMLAVTIALQSLGLAPAVRINN